MRHIPHHEAVIGAVLFCIWLDFSKMAYSCCHCDFSTPEFEVLIKHYRFEHGNDPNFKIVCGINNCAKSYSNIRVFRRHIRQKHEFWYGRRNNLNAPPIEVQVDQNEHVVENGNPENIEIPHPEFDVNREVSMFLMKLREIHKTPQAACSFVANEFVDLLKIHRENLEKDLNNMLMRSGTNIDCLNEFGLAEIFQEGQLEQAFNLFSNSRNLQKYMINQYNVVEPCEYVLGRDDDNGKEHTMQYIPILQTLKALLKSDDILGEVYGGHASHIEHKLSDFCDGSKFKSNALFSEEPSSLQVQLYYDDFTVANPLGTHVQMLKFSAVYFVLGNLHPMHRSKLRNIQLVSLCPSLYVKTYGLQNVFFPLLEDLKVLEKDGIQFSKDGMEHTFRGTVSFLSADNLAAHEIGGFQVHFNHGRVCRMCNVTTANLKNHFCLSDKLILRSKEVYDQQTQAVHVNPALMSTYGVKGTSCLNQLTYFHVTNGLPPDLAHDLFEGVLPEVVGEVIKDCVSQEYFTLKYLNQQIKSFPYEASDRTNKPSVMSNNLYTFRVKQTACQMWCFNRMLPLMVGHLVPIGCLSWKVLLLLLDVTEYCTSAEVTPALSMFLDDLIQDFLTSYYTFFHNVTMKPKFHYLIHYPAVLLQFGPLINTWTLRFEGKHNYFKEISKTTKNRKNLCKTLAQRHEFMQATFRGRTTFLTEDTIHTKGEMFPVRLLPLNIQDEILPLVGEHESVYSVGKVSYNGTWYSKGLAVIVDVGYKFGMIDMCFIIAGHTYLLCKLGEHTEYISHLHAYNVQFGNTLVLFRPSDLHNYYPLGVYKTGSMNLISIRHYVRNL
ncbi:uncharacterized protein [Apostichopus japonicus]|uniref:uncharacterized protein isoform X1 n=1 Tax=Stichopus japonicus TaxID=307972 RepID=UPI003AB4F3BA